ncbi:MAG: bifunctional hydroxymethylpyrimidine kinase/phosphomethylpyrimidine kinase [Salaquimonas sp.]|jgi:hydroxymethylpyrimidine/phosphomethylpyrimidine kinase|nr:bifunctional hydroxymethylpyrimidine kinase/phosphomethylpyrimidine kinase [Salaquimonas sp.]
MPGRPIPIAVTIAGSDSGGGAGIQADIKSMSANGVYAASIITALTAQNTLGVTAIHDVPADFITAQIDAVFSDLDVAAVKIGMLSRAETIAAVADGLRRHRAQNIVLDPVMVAASGDPLLHDEAVAALVSELFPLATLITPNLHEAARLTGMKVAESRKEMAAQADELALMTIGAILLKGGHGASGEAEDVLVSEIGHKWFSAPRIDTANTHGTGCSLSSAIAAHLALGKPLADAVGAAKKWLTGAIAASDALQVGRGHGPIHHFHELWRGD